MQDSEKWVSNAVELVGGQEELLQNLVWFCIGFGPKTLALHGPSGCGKSYLIEKLTETAPASAPKLVLLSAARWYEQQSTTQLPALRRQFEPHLLANQQCVLVLDRFEAVTEVFFSQTFTSRLPSVIVLRRCCGVYWSFSRLTSV